MQPVSLCSRTTLRATLLLSATLALSAAPARAQGDDSATVKLIQILIAKGILTKGQAASLLSQAQGEAHAARPPARPSGKAGAAALATAEPPASETRGLELPKGTVRVTYVPQSVRDQIAQQVRDQVLGEEQKNGWAAPNALPEWTRRITVYGDLRLRGERVLEDPGNKESVASQNFPFVDFNGINQGVPFDNLNGTQALPTLNATEDRTRLRVRARLGVKADIDDWISTDIRIATGNDNSPVTTNQTLGQGTNFGKYSIWLDRAYALLKVPPRAKLDMLSTLQAYVGRFGNPFWTTDLVYSDDLNFDGAAMQAVAPITPNLKAWFTGGAFEVYNTDFNYANSANYTKFASRDKYLFAAQAGVDYQPAPAIVTKLSVGLFNYQKIEGKDSSCFIQSAADVCQNDNSRPQFAQFGNTYFPLRNGGNASQIPVAGGGVTNLNPQYFGLASKFNVLDLHGRVQFTRYDPWDVELEGEYLQEFSRSIDRASSTRAHRTTSAASPRARRPAPSRRMPAATRRGW